MPTEVIDSDSLSTDSAAVISWRWDRDPLTGRSLNTALALKYAQEADIAFVFIDAVTVDQTQPSDLLRESVANLAVLCRQLPVIAAYHEGTFDMGEWWRTFQRPWILSEVRAYCQNPTAVTHVGFRYDATECRDLSFANHVSVVRGQGYASAILDVVASG